VPTQRVSGDGVHIIQKEAGLQRLPGFNTDNYAVRISLIETQESISNFFVTLI
jgi:hypothetical protein